MYKKYWAPGQQRKLAASLGVNRQYVNDVLHRRTRVSAARALKLESITGVPWQDWIMNSTSKHPAFFGKPAKKL